MYPNIVITVVICKSVPSCNIVRDNERCFHRKMKFSKNLRMDRKGWRRTLAVIAIFSLTVTLATRFSIPPDSHIHAFKSDSSKSGEPKRLDRDAVSYAAPGFGFAGFDATPAYAHVLPSSTVGTRDVISTSLYNRPPPYSFSI